MAPQQSDKQYFSVDSSEELGMVVDDASSLEEADLHNPYPNDKATMPRAAVADGCCSSLADYLRSYRAAEMIFCVAFFLVTNALPSSWLHFQPYQRPIPVQYLAQSNEYVRNLTHDEPYDGETVPWTVLILVSGVLPLVLQVLLSCTQSSTSLRILEVHQTCCVYFVAWSTVMIAVEFVKNYVGYLRPLFFQACQPNDDYSECTAGGHSLRKSFPSGHAATAFCGMTLLASYIHHRFGVYSKQRFQPVRILGKGATTITTTTTTTWRVVYEQDASLPLARIMSIVALAPLFVALYIAASRVRDNKHFPADVLAGALIGSALARYSHGLWFV